MLQYVQLFHAISCSFTLLRTQYVYIHPFMTMDGVIHVQTFVARWTPFIGRSVLRQCPQQGFFSQCQLLSNPSIFPEFSTVLHYVSLECDENHTFTRTFELFSIRSKCWNMLEYVGIELRLAHMLNHKFNIKICKICVRLHPDKSPDPDASARLWLEPAGAAAAVSSPCQARALLGGESSKRGAHLPQKVRDGSMFSTPE